MDKNLLPSEKWWQKHGGGAWLEEIERRRRYRALYFLQEIFLRRYFQAAGPARVLEFGCGYGRHLSYLRKLPGLELHGCDQSPTMVAQARELLQDEATLTDRIVLLEPRRPLPYPDKFFDITYTVSVLIHVPTEHLGEILGELLRVTKHHLLHIENKASGDDRQTSKAHDGCWEHNLSYAYAQAGRPCVILPKHFEEQDIYRVALAANAGPLPAIDEGEAAQSLALDRAVSAGRRELLQTAARKEALLGHRGRQLAQAQNELKALRARALRAESILADWQRQMRIILDSTRR